MMINLHRSFAEPLSEAMLFAWHRMLFKKRGGLRDIGRYRRAEEPMEIVSGPIHKVRVHFEAPPSPRVPKEMARFLDWFRRTTPAEIDSLPSLTRAGIAHLYFESIHPFEDGNGRIGRAIAEKALAEGFGQPTLTALPATTLLRRKAYYAALEAANKSNEGRVSILILPQQQHHHEPAYFRLTGDPAGPEMPIVIARSLEEHRIGKLPAGSLVFREHEAFNHPGSIAGGVRRDDRSDRARWRAPIGLVPKNGIHHQRRLQKLARNGVFHDVAWALTRGVGVGRPPQVRNAHLEGDSLRAAATS